MEHKSKWYRRPYEKKTHGQNERNDVDTNKCVSAIRSFPLHRTSYPPMLSLSLGVRSPCTLFHSFNLLSRPRHWRSAYHFCMHTLTRGLEVLARQTGASGAVEQNECVSPEANRRALVGCARFSLRILRVKQILLSILHSVAGNVFLSSSSLLRIFRIIKFCNFRSHSDRVRLLRMMF